MLQGAVSFLESGSSRKPPLIGRGGGFGSLDRASRGSSVESPASVVSAVSLRFYYQSYLEEEKNTLYILFQGGKGVG